MPSRNTVNRDVRMVIDDVIGQVAATRSGDAGYERSLKFVVSCHGTLSFVGVAPVCPFRGATVVRSTRGTSRP